ncbi:Major facilitator superfamily domain general substrate transporter [Penicillium capsulatum]|uniref:Major facilitator superfamily domain general substrate transporter n=1 Tax=Penicillium capsulatum TaxID=69766 RepID=A0A9W9I0R9_9EURO|nr:Major facilitator superfamily domain general substrate transporter [Penicillium capsulatum]KAJ6103540.1 Major facilitator superfamily domain general substrate transporter [Penicillium capsulatum]KAJ6108709.1 Major facilitator superfamily domain general substrate transporter [Penicillium capsulatum]KAJ6113204.1 Major facilitator superfamily domain general substrate transporter [Penicillium capsulatum]
MTTVYTEAPQKTPYESITSLPYGTDGSLARGVASLGEPAEKRRFWFQRSKNFDPNAIATQRSVYDNPDTAKQYEPRSDWENFHRFDSSARWTWAEEDRLIRKIDLRIMVFACVMFMALELDRSNLQQALTDNFLNDLHMNTNDYNLGNTVFRLAFLCAELPSQLVSKWVGPDRWIPTQMVLWSAVAMAQYGLQGKTSFLVCRALLGILQGGFIPDIILYLSYFYKHHELSVRLSFFWTAMSIADILASFLAFGLLHLRGTQGQSGWCWLFLIEGLITLVVGLAAYILMPPGPCQTAHWSRGKSGWFSPREETVMVNRVIRDDPSKGTMHNREAITPKLLWKSLCDYDLWPLYILGLTFETPMTTPKQYLTLTLRGMEFSTFVSNLLTIPSKIITIVTMIALTYLSEVTGQLTWIALLGQIWVLPFVVYLYVVDTETASKWAVYAVITLLLGFPNAHAIQVNWNSRNANTVRSRTVSAAVYNMTVQASSIIASNIYRADDAPRYRRGNRDLIGLVVMNIFIYVLVKIYYVWRNASRDKKWNSMTTEQKAHYLETTTDEGNKRLDFRLAH